MRIEIFQSKDLNILVEVWNRNLHADPISPIVLETRVLLDPNFREEFSLVAYDVESRSPRRDGSDMAGFILGICGDGFHFPGSLTGDRAWILAMAVDARHRAKGVGSDLLRELEQRFRDAGKRSIWIASYPTAYIVPGVDEAAYSKGLAFLQKRGYQSAYTAFSMDASLWPPTFSEIVPRKEKELAEQEISFYTYSSGWLSAFRAFLRSQVSWDWEWLALRNLSRIGEGTFSPEQFHLAVFRDQVVGYCQYEGEHFGPFGVAEEFQRKGIGTVLLGRALSSMSRHGMHNAWVLWTGEDTARLYARFGFRKSRKFAVLRKEI